MRDRDKSEDYLFRPPWETHHYGTTISDNATTIEARTVDGHLIRQVLNTDGSYSTLGRAFRTTPTFEEYEHLYRSGLVSPEEYEHALKEAWEEDSKGGPNTKVYKEKTPQGNEYAVTCDDPKDLSIEYILKNLSKIKGKLMLICAPVKVDHFICKMTPEVKKNIIMAHKKLNMYGKEPPIIARFDDYGNRLPDKITIDTISGVELRIVDPDDYGPYYLEIKAICERYEPERYVTEEDLPF